MGIHCGDLIGPTKRRLCIGLPKDIPCLSIYLHIESPNLQLVIQSVNTDLVLQQHGLVLGQCVTFWASQLAQKLGRDKVTYWHLKFIFPPHSLLGCDKLEEEAFVKNFLTHCKACLLVRYGSKDFLESVLALYSIMFTVDFAVAFLLALM